MQSTFINVTNHLQVCSAEMPSYYIIIQADFMLIGEFATFITKLLTLFFLVENGKLSILCLF